MTSLTLTPDVDVTLSPASSFTPTSAVLFLGDVRVDLSDADQCDHLAQLLTAAAKSLRMQHRPLSVGGRD